MSQENVEVVRRAMNLVEQSGAPVDTFFGMVFTLEDSKIKWAQIHVDPEDALIAAGLREG